MQKQKLISHVSLSGWLWAGTLVVLTLSVIAFCVWSSPASMAMWNHLNSQASATLAAWVSAVATVFLLIGLFLTKQSIEESKRTALLELMHQRFIAPNLRYARAVFAKTHLGRKRGDGSGQIMDRYVPDQGFQIINFLNEVGHLVKTRQLDIEGVELAFGTHIQAVGGLWKQQFDQAFRESRYGPFLDLYNKVMASPLPKAFSSELDLYLDEPFWECEAALDARAKSQDAS